MIQFDEIEEWRTCRPVVTSSDRHKICGRDDRRQSASHCLQKESKVPVQRACTQLGKATRQPHPCCWCRARQLTDEQRAAVANYFSIYKGTENGMAKLMVPSSGICQPSLERALDFIKEAWEEVGALIRFHSQFCVAVRPA